MNEHEFKQNLKTRKRVIKSVKTNDRCHAIRCTEYSRVLCVSNFSSTTKALSVIPNTYEVTSCNRRTEGFWKPDITAENCIYWAFTNGNKAIPNQNDKINPKNFEDFNEYYHCMLVNEKSAALDRLHIEINYQRRFFSNDLLYQQTIYDEKYREAMNYLSDGSSKDAVFLPSYAEQENISLEEASKRIVQMRKFQFASLNETEIIRQKYTKKIIQENSFFELSYIVDEFTKEMYEHNVL